MMAKRYHVSRHIDAPVERVWALLTDASSYRAWNRAVVSIQGPITKGATISLVSIVDPKRTFKLKVTEMTPPNRMVWGDSMPLGVLQKLALSVDSSEAVQAKWNPQWNVLQAVR